MKRRIGMVLTVCLLMTIVFAGTSISSQAKAGSQADAEYYHTLEMEYVRKTRTVLKEAGFADSGVNLTKIIDENGNRTYTMLVHNRKIDRLSESEKEGLIEALQEIVFGDKTCKICHEFLSL